MSRSVCLLLMIALPAMARAQDGPTQLLASTLAPSEELSSSGEALTPLVSSRPWERWYGSAEYLLWWLQEGRIPGLLSAGMPGTSAIPGQDPDARWINGPGRLQTRHGDRFCGIRATLGCWLDAEETWAIEGEAFFLERDSTEFEAVSDGNPTLAVPRFNPAKGIVESHIVAGAVPGGTRGGGMVGYTRVELFGQQANLVRAVDVPWLSQLDLLLGVRFLEMRDRADPTTVSRLYPDGSSIIGTEDHLRAHNFFYGGQIGARGRFDWRRWTIDGRGLAAFGADRQLVRTWGYTITHARQSRRVDTHGLFIYPSNSGRFQRNTFDMVYEVGANLRYQLTDCIQFFGGYTLILWCFPIRAGDQIDTVVDPSQAIARPTIPWRDDLLWAQGLNLGLRFGW
ncbi:MAG: hypothetical protein FJ271_33905 [Planctomycetes bacterium]|nr:hypothetical protein [Planctomycetota bacterium]